MSAYAKYLERYFSSVTEYEEDLRDFANSFHEVLIAALSQYGDAMSDSSLSTGDLSGKQVARIVPQLIRAEKEAAAEVELQRSVRRYHYPSYFEKLPGSYQMTLSREIADAIAQACPSDQS
jgi:hypothetical protein